MKYLTSAITALLIIISYSVLLNLSKQTAFLDESGNGFIVKFPKILDFAARLNIVGGVLFDILFLYKFFKKDPKITVQHFIIGVVFVMIGIVLEFVYVRWNIAVDENKLTCNRIFKTSVSVNIEEIDNADLSREFVKISTNNKVITYIDKDCDNFDKICEKLAEYGKAE